MIKNAFLLFSISLVFFACKANNNGQKISEGRTIPYQLAQNYFVNNTYSKSGVIKIEDLADFNTVFGMATVMGEKGKPTPINFNKNFVIAIIGEESNAQPSIAIHSLIDENNKISLDYSINNGAETTYSTKPSAILIVDRVYDKKLENNNR